MALGAEREGVWKCHVVYKLRGPEEGGPNVEGIRGVESKYGHRVLR